MNAVSFKPSTVRELYDRVRQLREEATSDSDFDRRFHGVVRDDLHRLRALCDEKKSCMELTGMQIAALDRLQPHINDLQSFVTTPLPKGKGF